MHFFSGLHLRVFGLCLLLLGEMVKGLVQGMSHTYYILFIFLVNCISQETLVNVHVKLKIMKLLYMLMIDLNEFIKRLSPSLPYVLETIEKSRIVFKHDGNTLASTEILYELT